MKEAATEERVRVAIYAFSALYILGFGVWFFLNRNEEFFSYMVVVFAVLALVVFFANWLELPTYILGLLSFAGLMHLAGGGIRLDGDVLYGYHIITLVAGVDPGLYILRYDQLVHAVGYGIVALTLWHVLGKHAPALSPWARMLFAALGAMGIGSLNEVIEFLASVNLAHTGVGDYDNNSLDLVFNMVGSVAASAAALAAQKVHPSSGAA